MEGTTTGCFNEMTVLNGVPLTAEQQLDLADIYGGAAAWAAPAAPSLFLCLGLGRQHAVPMGKQVASHFGGTRDPMLSPGRSELPARVKFDLSSRT